LKHSTINLVEEFRPDMMAFLVPMVEGRVPDDDGERTYVACFLNKKTASRRSPRIHIRLF